MIRLGLVGYPLEHSLSPRIHQSALRALALEGEYRLYPLKNDARLPTNLKLLLDDVRSGYVLGLNVTVPYKQLVMPYLDHVDQISTVIGAVNTIYCSEGQLYGTNTDAPGFTADLWRFIKQEANQKLNGRQALVLGAGGSARAVIFALVTAGWSISLAARRLAQAQELARDLHVQIKRGFIDPVSFDTKGLKAASKSAVLLVNTTPVGMWPEVDRSPWPEDLPMPTETFVYDLVYNPARTLFLKQAQHAGLPISNGIGMLVEQAAQAFVYWTKKVAPRKAMITAVSEYLIDLI